MIRLPANVLNQTINILANCGNGRCECVVFWTGPAGRTDEIDGWDHPTHRRSPYSYQVDDSWLTKYWFRLGREKRSVRIQVHTHPGEAFHSATDDQWPIVSLEGFVSIVIPNFALDPIDLEKVWTGVLQSNGTWKQVPTISLLEITK